MLDLTPEKSFIKWCVDQGLTVFVISWVNPDEHLAKKTFDDYVLDGPLAALGAVTAISVAAVVALPVVIDHAIAWPLAARLALATALLTPLGLILGVALPSGMRLVAEHVPALIPWGWGINGAFSVVGATFAVFIAMNWGFSVALLTGGAIYVLAAVSLLRIRPTANPG